MNRTLEEDFQQLACCGMSWKEWKGKSFFITGGTGFIGSLIIKFLDYLDRKENLEISVLTLARDRQKAECILEGCKVHIIEGDICQKVSADVSVDFLIHCAAVTKSKEMIEKPVDVGRGLVLGTDRILEFARNKKVKSMVYLSSMEVYGQTDPNLEIIREENAGYVDSLHVRSCYPLGKRMAENLCCAYAAQYGLPVKIARLAQVFGPGVLPEENRVFMQFAQSALKKEDIILHTRGDSIGNYCYTADALKGILLLLQKGENGEAYNLVNEANSMSIKAMAELVAQKIALGKIKVKIEISNADIYGYPPPTAMRLSGEKIRALGWTPEYGMKEMYQRMLEYIKESFLQQCDAV